MGSATHHPLIPAIDNTIAARRRDLFRETPAEMVKRWTLGTAWALKPSRIVGLPALGRMLVTETVAPRDRLPDPAAALARPAGLCGIVRDLSAPTLVEAHRRGLYPFAHIAPLKWWAPPERCVLAFGDFHMSRRLRGRLRQGRYRVSFDRAFEAVIKACSGRREGKWHVTWITPQIMHAYAALHDAGHAHSFEVWNADGDLVGGGYGVAVGGAFTVESQFTRESHTSKIGFAVLNWHLAHWGFQLNDNKGPTPTVLEMGFRLVPRCEFQSLLAKATRAPVRPGPWSVETDLKTVADWQPAAATIGLTDAGRTPLDTVSDRKLGRFGTFVPAIDVLDGELMGLSHALAVLL